MKTGQQARTTKIKGISFKMTNREKLIQIRDKHGLTRRQIAMMCGVSEFTVKSWLLKPESSNHRDMPDRQLKVLRYLVTYNLKTLSIGSFV